MSGTGDPHAYVSEPARKMSLLPIWVAAAALVASTALMFVGKSSPGPIIGWILTPFVVVACLAWARMLVVSNSNDPWFNRPDARKKLLVLQLLTLAAFVASVPHVWRIGQEVALWLQ
jgi:hypothetical protein